MSDFQSLLDEWRVRYYSQGKETRAGWLNFRCPFCNKDPYMGYNLRGRYVHCWSCGRQSLSETMQLLSGLPYRQLKDLIEGLPTERLPRSLLSTGSLKEPFGIEELSTYHKDYLYYERKLDPKEIIRHWGIKGIGQHGGHLRWRIYIPIHLRGVASSWTTRAIRASAEPRYWSARDCESAIPIGNLLYGVDFVSSAAIIVEGPVDAWAIGPGAVALCGVRTSPCQLDRLSSIPVRVICFDNEPRAQQRARRLTKDLSVFPGRTLNIKLESGKDAASISKEELTQLRRYLK